MCPTGTNSQTIAEGGILITPVLVYGRFSRTILHLKSFTGDISIVPSGNVAAVGKSSERDCTEARWSITDLEYLHNVVGASKLLDIHARQYVAIVEAREGN